MADIPAEAVQAALDALEAEDCNRTRFTFSEMARVALEAASPFIAEQARREAAEHIAAAIRAESRAGSPAAPGRQQITYEGGLRRAARIAREAFPKGADQ